MYLLINIVSNYGFYCEEDIWVETIEAGKRNGWLPAGTRYDLNFEINYSIDDDDTFLSKLNNIIIINNKYIEWSGDYFEKSNQIVTGNDAISLFNALCNTRNGRNSRLLAFIRMGAFRIHEG